MTLGQSAPQESPRPRRRRSRGTTSCTPGPRQETSSTTTSSPSVVSGTSARSWRRRGATALWVSAVFLRVGMCVCVSVRVRTCTCGRPSLHMQKKCGCACHWNGHPRLCVLYCISSLLPVCVCAESGQPICGNGLVEAGEQCDCGYSDQCKDECCYNANEADGNKCKLKPGKICR